MKSLTVYIGYDAREDIAFRVAAHSIQRWSSIPLRIVPLVLNDLVKQGLHKRRVDPLASTEFTFTRFLAPFLSGYSERCLYFDCDFLWTADVAELLTQATGDHAVWCVKHEYKPAAAMKMDGKPQSVYPRKNWSSLMLFNSEHASCRNLTPESVNEQTPAYLHRLHWARDSEIGELDVAWNWLAGWNDKPAHGHPLAIHYTTGGPWFSNCLDVDYADLWFKERQLLEGDASGRA